MSSSTDQPGDTRLHEDSTALSFMLTPVRWGRRRLARRRVRR